MKVKPTYRTGIHRAFAAVMLFLLLSLEGLQAAHRHSCMDESDHSPETEITASDIKCQICEYFAHQLQEPAEHPFAYESDNGGSLRPLHNEYLLVQLRELMIERSSNKGPPSLI